MSPDEIVSHLALAIMATKDDSTEPFGEWKKRTYEELHWQLGDDLDKGTLRHLIAMGIVGFIPRK